MGKIRHIRDLGHEIIRSEQSNPHKVDHGNFSGHHGLPGTLYLSTLPNNRKTLSASRLAIRSKKSLIAPATILKIVFIAFSS